MKFIGFTVHGTQEIQTYTTKAKAQKLIDAHPKLDLFMVQRPVTFSEWLFLKILLF